MKLKANAAIYYFFAAFFLLEFLISISMQVEVPRNGDVSIHIHGAERIIAGEKLYRDMVMVSFPMQFYLRIPGIFIAQWLDVDKVLVAGIFDNLIAAFSIGMTLLLLRKTVLGSHPPTLCLLGCILYYLMCIFPINDMMMGQKEYFFFLFTLPYFTLTAIRAEKIEVSRNLRIFIGLTSAIGFCYKPFCIIPLLLTEGYLCWKARSPRQLIKAEFISCAAVGVVYLGWMILTFPEYFNEMLPIAQFYYIMHPEYSYMARYYVNRSLAFLIAGTMVLLYHIFSNPPRREFFIIFGLTFWGYALDAYFQMKHFLHHLFPMAATAVFLMALMLAFIWAQWKQASANTSFTPAVPSHVKTTTTMTGTALAGLLILSYYFSPYVVFYDNGEAFLNRIVAMHQQVNKGKPFSFYKLGYRIAPMFPQAVNRGMSWNYHFFHLWPLAGISNFKEKHQDKSPEWVAEHVGKAEEFVRTTVTDDLLRLEPTILLVERLNDLDLVRFFSYDRRFDAFMRHYELEDTYQGIDIYSRQDEELSKKEQMKLQMKASVKRRQDYHSAPSRDQ